MASDTTNIRKMWDNSPIYSTEYEYHMPRSLANGLITAENKKVNDPQKFLVEYVNREFGLKGHCTKVVVV
jgi:hypothetical protein